MTPAEFVAKWSRIQQKETATAQSHFNDVCRLVGHATPLEFDPEGQQFSFEAKTVKPGGQKGFADVYFKGKFIWEYKGPHKDLNKAYRQLQLYREDLQNPPLLITSDIHTIIIHTNFNNYPTQKHRLDFNALQTEEGLQKLKWAFYDPEQFKPSNTQEQITRATAHTFLQVAEAMKLHRQTIGESYTDEQIAHFMARLLFCLFAEDLGLLPNQIFSEMVQAQTNAGDFQFALQNLFEKMRTGGMFGYRRIRYFDGTLFDDGFVPLLPTDLGQKLLQAAQQDWSQVDPSIFGTLFERVIDEGKRAQLGAHYTSETDIMLIVEPVLMAPLRQQWDTVRRQADRALRTKHVPGSSDQQAPGSSDPQVPGSWELPGTSGEAQAHRLLADFSAEIAGVRVLDPACGSGNFLYVALRELLNLQKQVIAYAGRRELPPIELTVSPEQLYGIEINPYAHELAQITTWIGYLQWRFGNGFEAMPDPVLSPLRHIWRMDAILAYDEAGEPIETEWPSASVIIGNPPFLGGQKILGEFGEQYTQEIRQVYDERVPPSADLVTYWFEKARGQLVQGQVKRVGLLATQSIRGEASRPVLEAIKQSGDIFMAWSDRSWILDGASVRVSLIGFDDGTQRTKRLNGQRVKFINSDLTATKDLTIAKPLAENGELGYMGIIRVGQFELEERVAKQMLAADTKNMNVVKRWIRGRDLTDRPQNMWIVDFGVEMSLAEAEEYELPLAHVQKYVKPQRDQAKSKKNRREWWLFEGRRTGMRTALSPLSRYIATPLVGKHRLFRWFETGTIPDARVIVIAREDDFCLGVLHSVVHELWALNRVTVRHGVGNDPTYNVSICLASFPFPWSPGSEPSEAEDERVAEIAHWARALVAWRQAWLHPPREDMHADGVGDAYEKMVKKRTLTNLYNGLVYYRETVKAGELFDPTQFAKVTRKSVSRSEIQELDDIHTALDHAVLTAYGWPTNLTDEEILARLLALNLERAGAQDRGS